MLCAAECGSLGHMNQISTASSFADARPYRMCAADYIRAAVADTFGDSHVELVEGELIEMAPSGMEHSRQNGSLAVDLGVIYRPMGYMLCIDAIVQLSEATIRAPDISVVDTEPKDRAQLIPTDILLAVEIADTTLGTDLGSKRIDYASAGIRHYWVVDIAGRRVHAYADPQGADYAAIRIYSFGEAMPVPAAAGAVTIA